MARRKHNKQPNLSEAALKHARGQVTEPAETIAAVEEAPAVSAAESKPAPAPRPRNTRRVGTARLEQNRKRGTLDSEKIEYLLENPTKTVSEAELRAEYSHVLFDLRNMGLLSIALIAAMILIAQVI